MKKIIVILICCISLDILPLAAFPQAGILDDTFNNDGIAIFMLGSQGSQVHDVVALPDSTLYICGYFKNEDPYVGFIIRVLNNGEMDPDFGTNGRIEFQMVSGFATTAKNMIILPDNKIVVSGQCIISAQNREFFIARFLPDGTPDPTFNSTGHLISSFGPGFENNYDMTMQADGKFVMAGKSNTGPDILFMRVNANGTFDTSFGTDGYSVISFSPTLDEYIADVDVLSDGTIVGAGSYEYTTGFYRSILVKLSPSGTPMPGFGTNGVLVPDLFNNYTGSETKGMLIRNDTLLLTGYVQDNYQNAFVARLDSSGNAITSFGTNGITAPGIGFDHGGTDILRQPDGKIYVCGTVETVNSADFILWRFMASGNPDYSFNNTGYVTTDVAEGDDDYSNAIDLQPEGKIVVAGYGIDFNYDIEVAAVTRYLNDWVPPACVAGFSADPASLCEGGSVAFIDLSYSIEGDIISWQWSFEGGTPVSSTIQNPVIAYTINGEYNVQLIASDGVNTDTLLRTDFIHVETIPDAPGTPVGPTGLCQTYSYNYTTASVPFADEYNWQVTPADAGTFTGDGTSVTFLASPSWTGTFDIQVSAEGLCGNGPLSEPLTCELQQNPNIFQLSGSNDGGYCEGDSGSELSLENSDTGVDYELYLNGVATGNIVAGTGSPVSFGFLTTEGLYTAFGYTDFCSETMLGQVYVHQWALPGQAQVPEGDEVTCDNGSDLYTTAEMAEAEGYEWILVPAEAGELTPAENSVNIMWNPGFSGNVSLSVHGVNDCGNGPESDPLTIDVILSPDPLITGPQYVIPGSEEQYQTEENQGNTYEWEVSGGTITSGHGTHLVIVLWGGAGDGSLTVAEASEEGCSGMTDPYPVVIDASISIEEHYPEKMMIYPNPADEAIYISFHSDKDEGKIIHITDLDGKAVNSSNHKISKGINLIRIATTNFKAGIYALKIDNYRPVRVVIIH